jgi:hypothetical protein
MMQVDNSLPTRLTCGVEGVGCVLYSLHVCVWVCQIRQLRLTIPSPRALSCALGTFLGGSQWGVGMPPPGYAQRSGQPPVCPFLLFLADFAIFS